jgi:methyl-accepting chemotaxis protein
MALGRLKVIYKILLIIATFVASMVVLIVLSLGAMSTHYELTEEMADVHFENYRAITTVNAELYRGQETLYRTVIQRYYEADEEVVAANLVEIREILIDSRAALEDYAERATGADADHAAEVLDLLTAYEESMTLVADTLGYSVEYAMSLSNTLDNSFAAVSEALESLESDVSDQTDEAFAAAEALTERMSLTYVIVAAASMLFSLTVGLLISRAITKPISLLNAVVGVISDGDFTKTVPQAGNDEIGTLSANVNRVVANLSALLGKSIGDVDTLDSTSDELASTMDHTSVAVRNIATSVEQTRESITQQSGAVENTSAIIEQLTANIAGLNQLVENQSAAVNESSAVIEEMVANIRNAANSARTAGEYTDKLQKLSDTGRQRVAEVVGSMERITRESEGLLEASELIGNIASQTNLLAMNAAIEAAHAGDAGKGFAVVAEEVRKLAEQAAEQSGQIRENLEAIKSGIDGATGLSRQADKSFAEMITMMSSVADINSQLQAMMEEQSEGTKQVLEALGEITDITSNVLSGATEMSHGNESILQAVKLLKELNGEVTSLMDAINDGTTTINTAIGNVSSLVRNNKQLIADLKLEMNKFTLTNGTNGRDA